MARIDGVSDAQAGLLTRGVFSGAKRVAGQVPEPLRIMAHSKPVMWADAIFELALQRAHAVPPRLKNLASIKVAALVGCVF
jgi:hypothetical protein